MPEIPSEKWPESTLSLLRDPYQLISKRCRHHQSDLFQILWFTLRKAICMTGRDAAALFNHDEDRFTRAGVRQDARDTVGKGGVQGLDGESHRHRKQMFMSLMAPERIKRLGSVAADWWGSLRGSGRARTKSWFTKK